MPVNEKIIAIIPARGGSKRVKNKNIRKIKNHPMILWTLSELQKFISKDKIIVSTDDKKIKKIVEDFGIKVPFKRPKEISDDFTITVDVAKHALDWYEKKYEKIKYVLIVYPTSIFLNFTDLVFAFDYLKKNKSCSVFFSACEFNHPLERAFYLKENKMKLMFPHEINTRTQDLKKHYYDAGQFYLCNSDIVRNSKSLLNENSNFITLPKNRVIDIDDEEDLELAKTLFKKKKI